MQHAQNRDRLRINRVYEQVRRAAHDPLARLWHTSRASYTRMIEQLPRGLRDARRNGLGRQRIVLCDVSLRVSELEERAASPLQFQRSRPISRRYP